MDEITGGIAALFDLAERQNEEREDFHGALPREAAEAAVRALLRTFQCRSRESASIYAYDAIFRALGIDWGKSTLVPLSAPPAPPDS